MHSRAILMGSDPAPVLRIERSRSPLDDVPLDALFAVARRDNPNRAPLLVSKVLGKHLDVSPTTAIVAGAALGELVSVALGGQREQPSVEQLAMALRSGQAPSAPVRASLSGPAAVVLSFAETATAIGHLVRRVLGPGPMAHTTRALPVDGALVTFSEEHSHAVQHRLFHDDPSVFGEATPVILVDDELTTGRTAMNAIAAIQRVAPRRNYVIAAYLDLRGPTERDRLAEFARRHGLTVDVVSLVSGTASEVDPDGTSAACAAVADPAPAGRGAARTVEVHLGARPTARRGWTEDEQRQVESGAMRAASVLEKRRSGPVALVLGTEELMFIPMLVGSHLSGQVVVRSTTRSPILVSSAPGYPITAGVRYDATDGTSGPRYLYNLDRDDVDDVFLFCEDVDAYGRSDLVGTLADRHQRVHLVHVLP